MSDLVRPHNPFGFGGSTRSEKGNRMKMYPTDWRVRLTTGVVVGACMAAAMMLGPVVGIHGFWPGGLTIIVAIIVGIVLGNQVGRLLFRPSSGGPPDRPRRD
jgi:hypothetical protein